MGNRLGSIRVPKLVSQLLLLILPLTAGVLLSLLVPRPIIGIITLHDDIYSYTAEDMIQQLRYARENPEVRAVVISLNSPGGTVTDTEAVYLEIARLREEKPVITLIESMAASGAYYIAVGTDYIYAKPSSAVGNIGVIGFLPDSPLIFENIYSTGPYKIWGEPRDYYVREMEALKQGFFQAVAVGRGEALKASKEEILRGQIWIGSEALRMGLIDGIGSQTHAYEKAAEMAHVTHYRVENIRDLADLPEPEPPAFFFRHTSNSGAALPSKAGIYYLHIPGLEALP